MNKLIMMDHKIKTVSNLENLLKAVVNLDFQLIDKKTTYDWIDDILKRFNYMSASKKHKGILKRYIMKMTGYSGRQVKRLIKKQFQTGKLTISKSSNRCKFKNIYTKKDIALLVKTDNLHNRLNGLATKKIFETEHFTYGKKKYERLSKISIAHIYNLRKTTTLIFPPKSRQ
ncbi:hypothetical protein A3J90_00440 [candidate division WOR-1 bacterium RIFOXYC2_FULL_37_10]|uniref:Uncharacterized protein n=1 Tax=candidate division WOR-1 bacterium RIFOXYB2_FULL_37_13 TaxID=1802579 RepID=A0A1F4SN03_UNCSA|nr:MAG: hypothetical protein A2310_00325 [candidate division WOR-1 bacterium RIFOXYB2_FULL_37_13]OGC32598.1 MAG: hypothetical protein A3J90_00440 [candidate division WOR-1 bacterium RIFOXYC2_FULL_37_10]